MYCIQTYYIFNYLTYKSNYIFKCIVYKLIIYLVGLDWIGHQFHNLTLH